MRCRSLQLFLPLIASSCQPVDTSVLGTIRPAIIGGTAWILRTYARKVALTSGVRGPGLLRRRPYSTYSTLHTPSTQVYDFDSGSGGQLTGYSSQSPA